MGDVTTKDFGETFTPQQTLLNALEFADDMEMVIVVIKNKDRYMNTAMSTATSLEQIGLLAMAQFKLMQQVRDNDD